MANICTNLVYAELKTENNAKCFEEWLENEFGSYDIDEIEEFTYEVLIDSKWIFPEKKFKELTDSLPDKVDDIYIRCLSYELGCYYHAMWLYEDNEWTEV